MAGPIRIEGTKLLRVRSIGRYEPDRTHEPPDARKEELRIAHPGLDFEGRDPEIAKIRRMAQVPEYENSAKRHEERPDQLVRMIRNLREDRNPRCGRKLRKAPTTAGPVTREDQRQMFEYPEERADLHPFRTWQRRKMAIDVVGETRVDACDGQARAAREQDLRSRLDKDRLPAMQHSKARRCGGIARNEAPIADDEQCDEKESCDHGSRIPETLHAALPSDDGFINSGRIHLERLQFGSDFERRLFAKSNIFRKIARYAEREVRGSLLEKTGHAFPTILACAHIVHGLRIESMCFHRMGCA